jgi:uncharacterized protein YbjT (DUF2867 family)
MPAFLIVGATGNTGGGVVKTLASLLPQNDHFSAYRIIALTRDANGSTAKELAKIDTVEIIEKDWTYIDAAWLQQHQVERLFIASHNGVTHFTDETLLLTRALEAGIKYLVRISTTRGNVSATTQVFYGRNHWAIENLLSQPEFDDMKWTSLQPNGFTSLPIYGAVNWIKTFKETGKKERLDIIFDENAGVALVDPEEVGIIAAHLLAETDITPHAGQRYVIVGPSNISGKEIVKAVERHAGTTVDDVVYRDTGFVENLAGPIYPDYLLSSLALAPRSGYEGGSSIEQSPTSPEVMKLYAPRKSAADALESALSGL